MCNIKEIHSNVIVNISDDNGFIFTTSVNMLVALADNVGNYLIGEPQDLKRAISMFDGTLMNIDDFIKWQKNTFTKDDCDYLLDYFTVVKKSI